MEVGNWEKWDPCSSNVWTSIKIKALWALNSDQAQIELKHVSFHFQCKRDSPPKRSGMNSLFGSCLLIRHKFDETSPVSAPSLLLLLLSHLWHSFSFSSQFTVPLLNHHHPDKQAWCSVSHAWIRFVNLCFYLNFCVFLFFTMVFSFWFDESFKCIYAYSFKIYILCWCVFSK